MAELQFEVDASGQTDHVVNAWQRTGGRSPAVVERLMSIRGQKRRAYSRAGVFRLPGVGSDGGDVVAKRSATTVVQSEAFIYREVLPSLELSSPCCYGWVDDGEQAWLFLEAVVGERFNARSPEHRSLATEWLARLHAGTSSMALATRLRDLSPRVAFEAIEPTRERLLHCHADIGDHGRRLADLLLSTLSAIEQLADGICERAASVRPCLVHADFVDKNVLVSSLHGVRTLFVLDWGTSGWGVPAPDLEYLEEDAYFSVASSMWPQLTQPDVAWLKAVGIVMRQVGIVHAWSGCLADSPEWTLDRLLHPTTTLAGGVSRLLRAGL